MACFHRPSRAAVVGIRSATLVYLQLLSSLHRLRVAHSAKPARQALWAKATREESKLEQGWMLYLKKECVYRICIYNNTSVSDCHPCCHHLHPLLRFPLECVLRLKPIRGARPLHAQHASSARRPRIRGPRARALAAQPTQRPLSCLSGCALPFFAMNKGKRGE